MKQKRRRTSNQKTITALAHADKVVGPAVKLSHLPLDEATFDEMLSSKRAPYQLEFRSHRSL